MFIFPSQNQFFEIHLPTILFLNGMYTGNKNIAKQLKLLSNNSPLFEATLRARNEVTNPRTFHGEQIFLRFEEHITAKRRLMAFMRRNN